MILTINNKNYELKFGLGFLAEMMMGDPLALLDLIKVATAHCPQKPSNVELEQYLTELAINNQIQTVFDSIFNEIKKSPILAYAMKVTEVQPQVAEVQPTVTQPTVTEVQPQVVTPMTTV